MNSEDPVTPNYHYADSPFGADRAPVTEPATTFAPGRLRASHAVCLGFSTLEPVICARKEEADIESVSTIERIRIELFAMRYLNTSFKTDSLHASSASSMDFRTLCNVLSKPKKRLTMALQRTATGGVRVSRWLLPRRPAAQPARHAHPALRGR